ncbi:MAG: HEAT repeat domain-containing protein [Planctomycetota bacterium]
MRTICLTLPLLVLLGSGAIADEVILKDGTRVYGEVTKEGEHVVVVDSFGKSVVLKDEVREIKGLKELEEEYRFLLERSGESPRHFELGCWCWKRGLFGPAREHFRRVLETDKENSAARWALGQVKVRGIWVEAGIWTRLPGKKKTWVRFVPEGAKGRLQVRVGEMPNDARDIVRKICTAKPEEREKVEAGFSAMAEPERREGLCLSLIDRDSRVRQYAVGKITSFKGPEVAKALTRTALCDPVRKIRKEAMEALSQGAFPMAREILFTALNSKHFSVRLNAINGLGSFPALETVEALCSVMGIEGGGSPRVNICVGRQFGYVRDFDVEVASMSAIGDPIVASQMEGVVLDVRALYITERTVRVQRAAAHRSLCRIAGKDLGTNAEVWRKWAKEKYGS